MKKQMLMLLFLSGALIPAVAVPAAAGFAFPSVQEGGTARAIALGSTYVGIADGSASLLWNPAGLSSLMRPEISLHHKSALEGDIQEIAILGLPMGYGHGLGLSLNYENNRIFKSRDTNDLINGDYSSSAYGAGVGWGMALPAGVSLGLGLKVNRQDWDGSVSTAFAGDAGVLWSLRPQLSLGAAYSNLGPAVQGRQLAQGLRVGVSSMLNKGENYQWLLALSGESLTMGEQSIHLAVEHTLHQYLALRMGYAFNVPNPQAAGLLGWTTGVGIFFNSFSIDYAYVPLAELGNMQRLSLTYAFGNYHAMATMAPIPAAVPMLSPEPTPVPTPLPAASTPTEMVLVLNDADFNRVVPRGEAELLSKVAEVRLGQGLFQTKGDSAYLIVIGRTKINAKPADESHEMTEIGKRRGNLVRNYLLMHAPPARVVTEVTTGARNAKLGGIFQVVVEP